MADRQPANRRKPSNPLQKKIPSNPKYKGVSPVVKTGKTIRNLQILSNQAVAKRKGEFFKRIRCSTLARLLQNNTSQQSIYQIGKQNEQVKNFDQTSSICSMAISQAPSVFSVMTVNTQALGLSSETEFMLLDLRETSEYQKFHIKQALSFPTPNISRDRIPPELHRMKNAPGKLIVVYEWDERPGVEASQKFAQRGYENIFLLSGGIQEFGKQFRQQITGEFPVQKSSDRRRKQVNKCQKETNEEPELANQIELEDENTQIPRSAIDDQYSKAGTYEPNILLTTSRKPSSRLMQFSKELKIVIPNTTRTNRGNYVIKELVQLANSHGFSDLIILHQHRGKPDGMIISHLPSGPTAYFGLYNVGLRHDLKTKLDTMSEEYPHLIFHQFTSRIGDRVADIIKYLFPVSKLDSKRILSFINKDDYIVFRHHVYKKNDYKTIELEEIGPRFQMKLYQISLGTVELSHAKTEWVLRPYMNTAKKRRVL